MTKYLTAILASVFYLLAMAVSVAGWVLPAFVGYLIYLHGHPWGGLFYFLVIAAMPSPISLMCSLISMYILNYKGQNIINIIFNG